VVRLFTLESEESLISVRTEPGIL